MKCVNANMQRKVTTVSKILYSGRQFLSEGKCSYCNFTNKPDSQNVWREKPKYTDADDQALTNIKKNTEATDANAIDKYNPKAVTKGDMRWRTPWHEVEGQYFSALRSFYSEHNNVSVLKFLHTPINLSPSAIMTWWKEKEIQKSIITQSYIPARNQILGNELAAAHFVVFRGGAVKFYNEDKWIKANEHKEYKLPVRYEANKILEAIDCSDMDLYYEGLANLRELEKVQWLSLNGCEHMDDWCLDRISNIFSHSLVYLDLRNCPNISERGIGALYKMQHLKILYLDNFLLNTRYEMTCLMLQDLNPHLDIRSDFG